VPLARPSVDIVWVEFENGVANTENTLNRGLKMKKKGNRYEWSYSMENSS